MPLLTPDTPEPRTPPTLEQKQTRAAGRARKLAKQMLQQLVQSHNELLETVYKNPQKLTAQQVYDGLGEDAAEAVTLSRSLVALINGATGETTIDTSKLPELKLNADGTVTVIEA